MADETIAEAIALLTRVSADTAKRLDALEAGGGSVAAKTTKGPRQVVKKAEPVMVTDFGPKAEKDLMALAGDAEAERDRTADQRNQNGNLLGLLGLAGAAALALKFLFDGEGFTGLVQGFQNAFKTVTRFASKAKGLVDDIGKKVGTFADDIGKKVGTFADDIGKKIGTFADDAVAGLKKIGAKAGTFIDDVAKINIKQAMDDIGKKVAGVTDDIINGFKNVAGKIPGFSKAMDSVAKVGSKAVAATSSGVKKVAEKGGSWWGKAAGAVKKGASAVAKGAKAVASTAAKGVKAAANFTKDQILKPVSGAISKLGPMKLLGGLAKSPLLAPVLESFFTAKDVNNLIEQFSAGEIDEKELNELVGKRLIEAITGVMGGAAGAVIGGSLGSFLPVAGNIIGAIAGGVLGDVGGRAIGGLIAKALGPKTGEVGEFALNSPLFKVPGQEVQEIEDGIITKDGKVVKPDSEDTLYAMKNGGPLVDILQKGSIQQTTELKKLNAMNESLLSLQIDILKENSVILKEIAEKTGVGGNNIITNNTSVTNTGNGRSLRDLQEMYA